MKSYTTLSISCCLVLLGAVRMAYGADLDNADKQFLITSARTDMVEAHEGQMAADQASRADVKDFAKTLVQDHTESYGHLTALASKTGVSIPKGIDTRKERNIEVLARLKGDRFDRQFSADEVAAHRRVLAEFKREADHAQNADVKAYAAQMIPTLEKHLQLAEACAKSGKRS